MTLLFGVLMMIGLSLLLTTGGYVVAGFLPEAGRLGRLAIASIAGLGWFVLGTSLLGAAAPLRGPALGLLWIPSVTIWLIPIARRRLLADLKSLAGSTPAGVAAGLALLWLGLLLPFSVWPDLVLLEGTGNHDAFFWCSGAEYLMRESYLTRPVADSARPLFSCVDAITGLQPVWGRMGAEGLLAGLAGTLGLSSVQIYNYTVCALALPWLLAVLALARRLGLPRLSIGWHAFVCFCQPVLAFLIANGNLPNLLGVLFGGGLWLVALLLFESPGRPTWPLVAAGALCGHDLLCSYPEITPFALLPVVLLAAHRLLRPGSSGRRAIAALAVAGCGALLLNPLTAFRAWHGFWVSYAAARQDVGWVNIFSVLNVTEYLPGLLTLSVSSVRYYGYLGGTLATLALLFSVWLVLRSNPRPWLILVSLSSGGVLLTYTILSGFSYGWLKAVLFTGLPLAVFFPVLVTGCLQDSFQAGSARRWLPRLCLLGTLGVMLHGLTDTLVNSYQRAETKGLTRGQLALRDFSAREIPGQRICVDGATFRLPFFQSMWSSFIFAGQPLAFTTRDEHPGGYLSPYVQLVPPGAPSANTLYYVGADWARAFDSQAAVVAGDRAGLLLRQHNLITEQTGFVPANGVPEWAANRFQFILQPYADGLLEIVLAPATPLPGGCTLQGFATTKTSTANLSTVSDDRGCLTVQFPLKAGQTNLLNANIQPSPNLSDSSPHPGFPFRVIRIINRPSP